MAAVRTHASGAEAGRRALAALAGFARDLRDFAFPQCCPGCGAPAAAERFLCDACRSRIPFLSFALCARCLAREREPIGCVRHPGHAVWPAWVYEERAALLVHALKYRARPDLAAGLAEDLARALPPRPRFDLVLAVPLHRARRRERGYNQSARLAEAVARVIGVPYLEGVIARVRATPSQARLDPRARRRNLAEAFHVRRPEWVKERNVLLVDDVITTGATFEACLDRLLAAEARVTGLALAWAQ